MAQWSYETSRTNKKEPSTEMSVNPFDQLGTDDVESPLRPLNSPISAKIESSVNDLAADWLRSLLSPNSHLNERLRDANVGLRLERKQGGKRWLAVGVELERTKNAVNELLRGRQRPELDQVSFSIGLSATHPINFRIGSRTDTGFYIGIRAQRVSPDGTLTQEFHDQIFDSAVELLKVSSRQLRESIPTTKKFHPSEWQRRLSPDYWSIWTYVARPSEDTSQDEVKEQVLNEYLWGLASLRGVFWQRGA